MKVCFSIDPPPDTASGGGAKFALGFKKFLEDKGVEVISSYDDRDPPDLIFMFDPRYLQHSRNWLTIEHIRQLQDKLNSNIPIIHRLNDIGYPKNRPQNYISDMVELANRANHAIYISNYVKDYYNRAVKSPSTVIYNGVDKNVFEVKDYEFDKIRLVTHHWSTDLLKGWDIYEQLDRWISTQENVEFTFIGRIPEGINLHNTKVYPATHGIEMANLIKKSNIYITASRHEPCGMHHLEGLACGLPYLYHNEGGGILEVGQFGLGFNDFEDFKNKLSTMSENHKQYYDKIKDEFECYENNIFEKYFEIIKSFA